MKKNKYFILLFGYTRIQLFTEVNGKITNIDFANGQNKLSNCVTFSYDKEDLEFVPDGDPFAVDQNSSFSDYLDFAGYHFELGEALEAIVTSIINNKLIPGLGKNDDIFIYVQAFQYETNHSKDGKHTYFVPEKMVIKGHGVYSYDAQILYHVYASYIDDIIGTNILIGYPFLTMLFNNQEDGFSVTYAPTMERSVVEKVLEQYPLPTSVPEKLLRNTSNKIFVSKLLDLPLPREAIYQNRRVDIAKTNLSKHFDVLLKEAANYFLEKADKVDRGPTMVFDFGMHPFIKESFMPRIEKPIFMDKEDNIVLTAFMLRNMIIQHIANGDSLFKNEAIKVSKKGMVSTFMKCGNILYFDPYFIYEYILRHKKNNILSNAERKELESLCKRKRDSVKDKE